MIGHTLRITIVAMALCSLPAISQAAPGGTTTLCHAPPGQPGNPRTLSVADRAVSGHLDHGDTLGPCPVAANQVDPPSLRLDTGIAPPAPAIDPWADGKSRPLARMQSGPLGETTLDFVENEIYLVTDDPDELSALQSRWPSTVMLETVIPAIDPGDPPTYLFLLNVDTSRANTRQLDRLLRGIDPNLHGIHHVSSEAALRLLTLVASEVSRHGLRVGINPLMRTGDIARRSSEEAAMGPDVTGGGNSFVYTPDAFAWPTHARATDLGGGWRFPNDTGVSDALRAVQAAGRLRRTVTAMVADAGFWPNADFPPYQVEGRLRAPNPDPGACGAADPTMPTPSCIAHGTHVALSGFALPDNLFGTMGPGGAVTDLVLLQSPSLDVGSVLNYIFNELPSALGRGARIINISASFGVDAGWCFAVCEPIGVVVSSLRNHGVAVVAAAGNNNRDVDSTNRFCIGEICTIFEETAILPCETNGVICVGANRFLDSGKAGYSNFGSNPADGNSIDIWAPGDLMSVNAMAADEDNAAPIDDLEIISGTSFAAPFTAGVLALVMASNPTLATADAVNCLLGSTQPATNGTRRPVVNALGAVSCAMGGTHPYVEVTSPADAAVFSRGLESVTLYSHADDYEDGTALTVDWRSSLEGHLGSVTAGHPLALGSLSLRQGVHEICASVTDTSLRTSADCIEIGIAGVPPVARIVYPSERSYHYQSSTLQLVGTATDVDGPTPTDISWWIGAYGDSVGERVSTSLVDEISLSSYEPDEWNDYWLELRVVDADGAEDTDRVALRILPDPDEENARPRITIDSPANGTRVLSDGGPVTFELIASAHDEEDGPLPFNDIDWQIRINGGPAEPLPLTTIIGCEAFDPVTGICTAPTYTYTFQVAPAFSSPTTEAYIWGTVRDSEGAVNSGDNNQVILFIDQLF